MRMLEPIANSGTTLADQVYDAIVLGILTNKVELGTPLIMDELAESLDVSRTPVRDALQRLEHEGLVEQRGRRGFIVRPVSEADVHQLYQAREAVEGYAARWIAQHADESFFTDVAAVIERAQNTIDGTVVQSFRANQSIHRCIVEAVGNRYLTANFDSIWGASIAAVAYGRLFLHEVGMQEQDIAADHRSLVEGLRSGDPIAAGAEMDAHIRDGLAVNLL